MSRMAQYLAKIAAEEEREWEPSLPSVVQMINHEIGHDQVLGEAVLEFVRKKKREMAIAKIVALRGQEFADAALAKLNEENN